MFLIVGNRIMLDLLLSSQVLNFWLLNFLNWEGIAAIYTARQQHILFLLARGSWAAGVGGLRLVVKLCQKQA